MQSAIVNNIIKNSSVDGPGNRLVVFFQGCNINCLYCHNPETINLCNNCGTCLELCPTGALAMVEGKVTFDKKLCIDCDACIKGCPYDASPKVTSYTTQELMKVIKKYRLFIRGVTFSGGECTLNKDFIIEISREIKQLGLDIYLDSNGYWDFEKSKELIDSIDKVMLDVKAWGKEEHLKLTSHPNEKIIENLKRLLDMGKLYEVRSVIIPGFLDNAALVENVSKIIAGKDVRYKLIKYRNHGVRLMGKFESPTEEQMYELKEIAQRNGVKDIIII